MFKVYATMDQRLPLSQVGAHARHAETLGYDGFAVPEAVHDGLLAAAIALQATTRLEVATSVLVAFPRSPMTVAHAAWDLPEMSNGRFGLGLGSQVKGNVVGRYSTAWSAPVPRMREYVRAPRVISSTAGRTARPCTSTASITASRACSRFSIPVRSRAREFPYSWGASAGA